MNKGDFFFNFISIDVPYIHTVTVIKIECVPEKLYDVCDLFKTNLEAVQRILLLNFKKVYVIDFTQAHRSRLLQMERLYQLNLPLILETAEDSFAGP